jgi:co-chaperonin GroES (HSP10)
MPVRAKPVGPHLLVKPLDADQTARFGLVLPPEVRATESRGVVQEVGDGWYRNLTEDSAEFTPLPMKRGDVVVYRSNSGVTVKLDLAENGEFEEFVLLHIQEVLLTLVDVPSQVAANT